MSITRCPDCAGEAKLIGHIPATDIFAGQVLESLLSGGSLYRCGQCLLGFRWPLLDKDELDDLYAQGNEQTWTAPLHYRKDWRIARDWVEQTIPAQSRILDMGCFDGGFLEPLLGTYHCYGIEIHPSARKRAEQKGIDVIGSDFSSIEGNFECITAFDVIENVEQPKSFLNDCLSAVRPGGWILISTGNLDAFTFHLMGSRYWYCTIAEHISFVSPAWFARLTTVLNYRILRQIAFSHGDSTWSWRSTEIAKNLLYRFSTLGFRKLRAAGMGKSWMSARDHFMILVQKQ